MPWSITGRVNLPASFPVITLSSTALRIASLENGLDLYAGHPLVHFICSSVHGADDRIMVLQIEKVENSYAI